MHSIKFSSLCFSCLFLLSSHLLAENNNLVKIATGEWAPFVSKELKVNGVTADIVKKSFAKQGISIDFGFFPWARAMNYAETGEWTGTMPWSRNPEREEKFYFSDAIMEEQNMLLHRKSLSLNWNSLADLKKYRIGATKGYSYGEDFEKAINNKTLRVQYVTDDLKNLKKLLNDRIDILVIEKNVAVELMQTDFFINDKDQFIFNSKALNNRYLHLLLSKAKPSNEALMNTFNKGLAELKSSGEYDAMLKDSLNQQYK